MGDNLLSPDRENPCHITSQLIPRVLSELVLPQDTAKVKILSHVLCAF
jgi:hypothetical protein